MAYDEELSDRIRELIGGEPGLREQKMFGGLVFLIDDHIAIAASGDGGLLVRLDPSAAEAMLAKAQIEAMQMGARTMSGFYRVDGSRVRTKRQLEAWTNRTVAYARSLPPKPKKSRR